MAACSHGAKLEVCKHIPKGVAQEFNRADAGIGILKRKKRLPTRKQYYTY